MNRLNKKFYIISFSIIIVLGIIAGILLVTKGNKTQETDYNYGKKESKSFSINDLTDKEKETAGIEDNNKLEDKKLYSEEYKKYLKLSEEERAEQEVIPRKYDVPYEKLDDIQDDLNKKENKNIIPEEELDPETKLPKKFNLADKIDIKVENQGFYGLCWDFASMKSLETYCLLNGIGDYDFSEIHLDYLESDLMYGTRKVHDGGNFYYFQKYINEFGVVSEESAPYREHTEEEYNKFPDIPKVIEVTETVEFPTMDKNRLGQYSDEEYAQMEKEFRKTVKEHIMKNGGLYTTTVGSASVNSFTSVKDDISLNHAVTIVGWDDNYSKSNFKSPGGYVPEHDGAYIALNSWGPNRNDKGYFYISYEDKFVEYDMNGIISTSLENAIDLDSLKNPGIKQYLEERYGHLLIEKNGKKYITKTIINDIREVDLSGRGLTSINGINIFKNAYNIDLSNNSITDISSLTDMECLGHVNLSGNKITNISPLATANLPNLHNLELRDNQIKNISSIIGLLNNYSRKEYYYFSIDVSGNKGIKGLEVFNDTNIYQVNITAENCDLKTIPDLTQVSYNLNLSVANNNLSDGLDNLPEEVAYLDISNNNYSDISVLENKKIMSINLEKNNISSVPTLNLKWGLNISSNPITDWDFLGNLNFIEEKDVEYEEEYDYKDFALEANNCNLSDVSVLNKINKEYTLSLSLRNNNIKDVSSLDDEHAEKCYSIDLSENKNITGIEKFKNAYYVTLQDCGIENLNEVTKLEKVSNLDLKNNNVHDVSDLSKLKNLESLSLEGNKELSGKFDLDYTYVINLSNCNLDNNFDLGNVQNLYCLNVSNNPNLTEISNWIKVLRQPYIYIQIDKLKYEDYQALNSTNKSIHLDDFQTELSIKENNSQVDFSNHNALKKLLMQNISNKRLDIENGIMTKRGYILNIIDLNNPTIKIVRDASYDDTPATFIITIIKDGNEPEEIPTSTPSVEPTPTPTPSSIPSAKEEVQPSIAPSPSNNSTNQLIENKIDNTVIDNTISNETED